MRFRGSPFRVYLLVGIAIGLFHWAEKASPAIAAADDTPAEDLIGPLEDLGLSVTYGRVTDDQWHISAIGDVHEVDMKEISHIAFTKSRKSSDERPLLPEKLFDILPRFPTLRSLEFSCFRFDPNIFRRLKAVRRLRRLTISSCTYGEDLRPFANADDLGFLEELPDLEWLRLASCGLTNEMVVRIPELKSLRSLNLSHNDSLTEAVLPILKKLPALESLNLYYTRFNAHPMVARRLAAQLKQFTYRSPFSNTFRYANFSLSDFQEIMTLPRRTWKFPHSTTVPLAKIVALLPGSVSRFTYKDYDRRISLVGKDGQGEKFELTIKRPLSDTDLAAVGQMSELRQLSIEQKNSDITRFTLDGFRSLTQVEKLEGLSIISRKPLTSHALASLSTMPSLRNVRLQGIDLDADSLAWVRETPHLKSLTLLDGTIHGDSLLHLDHAPNLDTLSLGTTHTTNYGVSVSKPTKPFRIDTVRRLKLASAKITDDLCRIITCFSSLESLTLCAPVTDAHLSNLTALEHLKRLAVSDFEKPRVRRGEPSEDAITIRGIQQFRTLRHPLFVHIPQKQPRRSRTVITPEWSGRIRIRSQLESAMANQFGWRFYGCSSGCCDTFPIHGQDWIVEGQSLKRINDHFDSLSDSTAKKNEAVRIWHARVVDRLVINKSTIPETASKLFLTDCHINELCLEGWLPKSISIWGNSVIRSIVTTGASDDTSTQLNYYFLEGENELVVPAFDQLSNVVVAECDDITSLRFVGFYPSLTTVECIDLDQLQYFTAPFSGDAPKLEFPADRHWGANLPALRLLKIPGTAAGKSEFDADKSRLWGTPQWFPPTVHEVDLRGTVITDEWLEHLAKAPLLRILKIGGCDRLTRAAISKFREARPDVSIDEETVHRP